MVNIIFRLLNISMLALSSFLCELELRVILDRKQSHWGHVNQQLIHKEYCCCVYRLKKSDAVCRLEIAQRMQKGQ